MTSDEAAMKMMAYAKEIGCRSFKFGELEAEFYPPPQVPQPHPLMAALRGIDPGPNVTDADLGLSDPEDPDRGLPKS